jgi:alcohol dehydrogenase
MRQLVFHEAHRVEWSDAPEPVLRSPDEALVRPLAVATCDIDAALLRGMTTLFPGPFAFGHEGVAEVVAVGPNVATVRRGDLVVVPFQISCGACTACVRGHTGNCTAVPMGSMYGLEPFGGDWGGFVADLVRVPFAEAMLVALPEGVEPSVAASASDNIADGWRTVAPALAELPGAPVLIVAGGQAGGGSIGLYAVDCAIALGAGRVHYAGGDPACLEVARQLGAEITEGPPPKRFDDYPITVDAGATPESLACALRSTAPDGYCTSVGQLSDTSIPAFEMFTKCVTFRIGRTHARPAIPTLLELIAAGRLHPDVVTSAVVEWDDAPEALADPPVKLVIQRPREVSE